MNTPECSNLGLHTRTDDSILRISCPWTLVNITSHDDREYTSKFKYNESDCLSVFITTNLGESQLGSNQTVNAKESSETKQIA